MPHTAHTESPTRREVRSLEHRISLYEQFLPDWPALAESFRKDLAQAVERMEEYERGGYTKLLGSVLHCTHVGM